MDLHFLRLWDVYHPLLTEHQREVTDLYLNCDLSLAEIAEQRGCSRQSISDTLHKARRQMQEYEDKLHVCRLFAAGALAQSLMLDKIEAWAQNNLSEDAAAQLGMLVRHDYSQEANALLQEHREKLD